MEHLPEPLIPLRYTALVKGRADVFCVYRGMDYPWIILYTCI